MYVSFSLSIHLAIHLSIFIYICGYVYKHPYVRILYKYMIENILSKKIFCVLYMHFPRSQLQSNQERVKDLTFKTTYFASVNFIWRRLKCPRLSRLRLTERYTSPSARGVVHHEVILAMEKRTVLPSSCIWLPDAVENKHLNQN